MACRLHARFFFFKKKKKSFRYLFTCSLFQLYFYLLANTTNGLTWWAMNRVKVTLQPTTMSEWDGYGMKIRRKACESGWYMRDSRRKVPTVGHLGELERDRTGAMVPPRPPHILWQAVMFLSIQVSHIVCSGRVSHSESARPRSFVDSGKKII
jgi:hypothetical protein